MHKKLAVNAARGSYGAQASKGNMPHWESHTDVIAEIENLL